MIVVGAEADEWDQQDRFPVAQTTPSRLHSTTEH